MTFASSLESRLGRFYAIPVQGSGHGFHDVAEEILPKDPHPRFSPNSLSGSKSIFEGGSAQAVQVQCLDAVCHDVARAFPAVLGAFARFGDLAACLAPDLEVRRAPGTFPIRGSPARTSSHARIAASSKSCVSAGRTCQPVTGISGFASFQRAKNRYRGKPMRFSRSM